MAASRVPLVMLSVEAGDDEHDFFTREQKKKPYISVINSTHLPVSKLIFFSFLSGHSLCKAKINLENNF